MIGYGINCARPDFTKVGMEFIGKITNKPIIAYPNDMAEFPKDWKVTESEGQHMQYLDT